MTRRTTHLDHPSPSTLLPGVEPEPLMFGWRGVVFAAVFVAPFWVALIALVVFGLVVGGAS